MITITPATQTVRYNPEFYVIKHWSHYVRIGAVRLNGTYTGTSLRSMAFKNPDGSIALLVQNYGTAAATPLIRIGSKEFKPTLEPSSVNTFNIGGVESTGNWVPATGMAYAAPMRNSAALVGLMRVYDIRGRLIKTIDPAPGSTHAGSVFWDQTDARGRRVVPGMYVIMSRSGKIEFKKTFSQ
jgi:hypothetical protein